MKKNMLTEINNIRRIMGLHLIMEDTKTEIYSLLKKLSSESTSETEKNEIKAILKRANVTDEEIQRLLRGGEQTLTQLTQKIEVNLTVELSDDLEKREKQFELKKCRDGPKYLILYYLCNSPVLFHFEGFLLLDYK